MSAESSIWLDGFPATALPLPDRGLDFGDGLFETLLLHRGRPLFLEMHLERLRRGLEVLHFPDGQLEAARENIEQALASRGTVPGWSALRLTITRGEGPRGYAPPESASPRLLLTLNHIAHNCMEPPPAATLAVAGVRWSTQPQLAGIKHLNRLEQVLAALEARRAGRDEALMLDQGGRPVSVSAGNLFMVSGSEIFTPTLTDCGIAGTRRQLLMRRWAPALGLVVRERELELGQLDSADELFYSNSLFGLRPISALGERTWHKHPVFKALHQLYREDLA